MHHLYHSHSHRSPHTASDGTADACSYSSAHCASDDGASFYRGE